ncbi:dienelactone hydrolase family protein [Sphingobium algorifonticola]|uniref:Carboxymethylenebutenolidase n=1 Tax=Sphingobium algorifonticola TaxID=2008318 RepID=A0A437JCQ4_9SPHN|nr:dienelactone hydrolase family protein [Sphingobium algorifonticola]RVT43708.1 carboxymethylenebutenolidase [Sphingobium algorifonticola]
MAMTRNILVHDGPGGPFEAMAIADDSAAGPLPGVLLIPNVLGTKEADFAMAERVAALGHVVLVADVYGQGKRTTRADPDMGRYMAELNADRALLKARLLRSLDVLRDLDGVDATRLAAIGYCFGGKCVLDLARCGAPIRGGVSFHGVYDPPPFANSAISAKLLISHGWDDPIAPPDAMVALAHELTQAGCDWQVHAYGHTGHAFTDRDANMPERGLAYQPDADRRSFRAMADFLAEILG